MKAARDQLQVELDAKKVETRQMGTYFVIASRRLTAEKGKTAQLRERIRTLELCGGAEVSVLNIERNCIVESMLTSIPRTFKQS